MAGDSGAGTDGSASARRSGNEPQDGTASQLENLVFPFIPLVTPDMSETAQRSISEGLRCDILRVCAAFETRCMTHDGPQGLHAYAGWLHDALVAMSQLIPIASPYHDGPGVLPLLWLPHREEDEQAGAALRSSMYRQPSHRARAPSPPDWTPLAFRTSIDAAQRRMGYRTDDPEEIPHSQSSAQTTPASVRDGAAPGERISYPPTPQAPAPVAPRASDHNSTPFPAGRQQRSMVRSPQNPLRASTTAQPSPTVVAESARTGRPQYVIPAQGLYTVRWLLRFRHVMNQLARMDGSACAAPDNRAHASRGFEEAAVARDSQIPHAPPIAGPSTYRQRRQTSTAPLHGSVQTSPAPTLPRDTVVQQSPQAEALRDIGGRAQSQSLSLQAHGELRPARAPQWMRDRVRPARAGITAHHSITVQGHQPYEARTQELRPVRSARARAPRGMFNERSRSRSHAHDHIAAVPSPQRIALVRIPTAGHHPGDMVTYTSLISALRGARIVFDWRGSLMSNWRRISVDVRMYAALHMERVGAIVWAELVTAVHLGHVLESQVEAIWRAWLGDGRECMEDVMEDSEIEDEERMMVS